MIDEILKSKNKVDVKFPFSGNLERPHFGDGVLCDALSFGFSYIEHNDHFVQYIIANPELIKKMIREVDEVKLTVETPYIGELWTSWIYVSDKIEDGVIVFSNPDQSTILKLHIK